MSAHLQGCAIDFTAGEFGLPLEVCRAIADSNLEFDQLIMEGKWVHISFDERMRRQVLTARFAPGSTSYITGLGD